MVDQHPQAKSLFLVTRPVRVVNVIEDDVLRTALYEYMNLSTGTMALEKSHIVCIANPNTDALTLYQGFLTEDAEEFPVSHVLH